MAKLPPINGSVTTRAEDINRSLQSSSSHSDPDLPLAGPLELDHGDFTKGKCAFFEVWPLYSKDTSCYKGASRKDVPSQGEGGFSPKGTK